MKLSLRRKIFLGFGIIVLLLITNATSVYLGSIRINREMSRMSEVEAVNAAVLQLDRDVQELRLRADRFVYSGSESQARAAREIFQRIERRIRIVKARQTDPEMFKLFEKINLRLGEYAENFDAVIAERKLRQDLVEDQLPSLAGKIVEDITRLANQFAGDAASDATRLQLVRSQSAFSEGDKSFLRYFENPDGELVDAAVTNIQSAVMHLENVDESRAEFRDLINSIQGYERVGLRAVQATRSYLFLRNVVIAGEESEVSYYSGQLRNRAAERRQVLASQLAANWNRIRVISWGFVVVAIGLSLLIATRLAFVILSPISELTTTFEKLSSGKVLSEIPGTERDDEIGSMAKAARIFSDQNLRTRELLEQSQALGAELREKAAQLEATNEELDSFAYVASHDLRSPLRGIKHLAQWIEEDVSDDLSDDGTIYLDNLKARVAKLEVLLEDLLDFSRVGRLNPAPEAVDIESIIENVVEMISIPDGISISWQEDLPTLETIRPPIEQVFMNLICNALKHHDKREDGWVRITCHQEGDQFRFSVSDNGPGINPKNFDRIFQMYQRVGDTSIEGSGMGLAIVKKQVEHFGGTINVESEPGRGTTFHFTWGAETKSDSAIELQGIAL